MDKFLIKSKSAKKNSVVEKESVKQERLLAEEAAKRKSEKLERKNSKSPVKKRMDSQKSNEKVEKVEKKTVVSPIKPKPVITQSAVPEP